MNKINKLKKIQKFSNLCKKKLSQIILKFQKGNITYLNTMISKRIKNLNHVLNVGEILLLKELENISKFVREIKPLKKSKDFIKNQNHKKNKIKIQNGNNNIKT